MANWPRLPLGIRKSKLPYTRRAKSDVLQAGLFAGILAAFLIESRKDLQEDSQQSLLRDILHTLRNDSDVSTSYGFHPSPSSLLVNYVWFISLTLTLVSALGGVLAKAWLAKYAPASPGVSSSDACERHLRALRAYQWRFGALIGGIPLLIQLSLFLFFAGLVPFIHEHDHGMGYTILVLIILTAAIYLFGTALPWFSPACPFQTTMSDFIPGVAGKARYKKDRASSYDVGTASSSQAWSFRNAIPQFAAEVCRKPEQTELEMDILSWIIVNSTVERNIEEAVRVIAGLPSTHIDPLRAAMAKSGAVSVLCSRFSRCFTFSPDLPVTASDVNQAEAYMYALILVAVEDSTSCLTLLRPGAPLRRWDNLQPCLQSVALCLRMEILLAAGQDDHREGWEQMMRNLEKMCRTGSSADVQKKLMDASINSVGRGGDRLQQIGAVVFSSVVKIGKSVQQFGSLLVDENGPYVVASSANTKQGQLIERLSALFKGNNACVRSAAVLGLTKLAHFGEWKNTAAI
jgi:hypothetical protein